MRSAVAAAHHLKQWPLLALPSSFKVDCTWQRLADEMAQKMQGHYQPQQLKQGMALLSRSLPPHKHWAVSARPDAAFFAISDHAHHIATSFCACGGGCRDSRPWSSPAGACEGRDAALGPFERFSSLCAQREQQTLAASAWQWRGTGAAAAPAGIFAVNARAGPRPGGFMHTRFVLPLQDMAAIAVLDWTFFGPQVLSECRPETFLVGRSACKRPQACSASSAKIAMPS